MEFRDIGPIAADAAPALSAGIVGEELASSADGVSSLYLLVSASWRTGSDMLSSSGGEVADLLKE
jgi:hypothetical protein